MQNFYQTYIVNIIYIQRLYVLLKSTFKPLNLITNSVKLIKRFLHIQQILRFKMYVTRFIYVFQ